MTTKRQAALDELNALRAEAGLEPATMPKGPIGVIREMIEQQRAANSGGRRRVLTNDKQISAVDIAKTIGVNPKIARAKLRRAYARDTEGALPVSLSNDNWVFSRDDEAAITELLKS